ncbi:hypothetical protein LCGC14_0068300 [marine sediment metagenome]|uniref:Uncharacterized protein n=1 Tax=marine sediment metagenome TaxID=412755 RepID=A0A0F9VQS9_9ZZZZ|nr:hypothetical protein [Maribacter sp.]HDZ04204.1 hypothetical protein [Maribacter sp.]
MKIHLLRKYVLLVFLFSFVSYTGFCQKDTAVLKGKIASLNNDVSNVLIINLNSKKSTITDSLGLFSIYVKLQDSLRITAVQYLSKEIIITNDLINKGVVVIHLIENIIDLSEVTVTPYNLTGEIDRDIDRLNIKPTITSYSLGLPNSDVTKMTQSQRLLQEADRDKYIKIEKKDPEGTDQLSEILSYTSISVVINTHKIMNRLSGRTKSLEEMVARDEKTEMERDIIDKFSKKVICDSFQISEENFEGFITFCISQNDFLELTQSGNSLQIWEYLKSKSIEFKEADILRE